VIVRPHRPESGPVVRKNLHFIVGAVSARETSR
jgi:hypothetical protein